MPALRAGIYFHNVTLLLSVFICGHPWLKNFPVFCFLVGRNVTLLVDFPLNHPADDLAAVGILPGDDLIDRRNPFRGNPRPDENRVAPPMRPAPLFLVGHAGQVFNRV
jgi:hypothetical protein